MKNIAKQTSPQIFEDWKIRKQVTKPQLQNKAHLHQKQSDIWKTFQKKTDVRNAVKQALLDEQGHICCYCQNRIQTTIEHFIPRSIDATQMFDFENLFVCCSGGEEERQNQEYPAFCGASKSNRMLNISPLDTNCEHHFDYFIIEKANEIQIGIKGKTEVGIEAINILNLDNDELRKIRGSELSAFIEENVSKEDIASIYNHYSEQISNKPNNKFPPFCIVSINILGKLIQ